MGAREEVAAKRAEIERLENLAELEESLAEAKASGDEDAVREASLALRDGRREHRLVAVHPGVDGDAAVAAPAISAKAKTEKPR
jgi:hypothetical protein